MPEISQIFGKSKTIYIFFSEHNVLSEHAEYLCQNKACHRQHIPKLSFSQLLYDKAIA